MPVLSTTTVRDVMFRGTKAKTVYLGTKFVWDAEQGLAKNYPGTGWYKATDTGIVFCKGIPSRQTHSFTGDPRVYVSVHTIADARLYAERAATSNMVDLTEVFKRPAAGFNADIRHWDVSNVTKMDTMFSGASSFNQNISNWDVSKVTNMFAMFASASSFNQNISNWDVGKVTNMYSMFSDASSFNQNISNWDVGKVTNMDFMFYLGSSFNQNLSKWCVTLIKYQPMYFKDGSALTAANTPVWGTCPPR